MNIILYALWVYWNTNKEALVIKLLTCGVPERPYEGSWVEIRWETPHIKRFIIGERFHKPDLSCSGLESFLFWTTAIISGVFLFTHITNLTQMLEAKFPFLMKLVIFLNIFFRSKTVYKLNYLSQPFLSLDIVQQKCNN